MQKIVQSKCSPFVKDVVRTSMCFTSGRCLKAAAAAAAVVLQPPMVPLSDDGLLVMAVLT